jgi:hypothetical protein
MVSSEVEAGDRQGDAVAVLVGALDVVGRVSAGVAAAGRVDQIEEPVEADAGAEKGSEFTGKHVHILLMSNMGEAFAQGPNALGSTTVRPDRASDA